METLIDRGPAFTQFTACISPRRLGSMRDGEDMVQPTPEVIRRPGWPLLISIAPIYQTLSAVMCKRVELTTTDQRSLPGHFWSSYYQEGTHNARQIGNGAHTPSGPVLPHWSGHFSAWLKDSRTQVVCVVLKIDERKNKRSSLKWNCFSNQLIFHSLRFELRLVMSDCYFHSGYRFRLGFSV